MLCDRCRKNEANVHVSKYINGAVYEQNLCSECAGLNGDLFMGGGFAGFGSVFDGFREMSMIGVPAGGMETNVPRMDTSGNEFEELGLKLPGLEEEPNPQEPKGETLESLKVQMEKAVTSQEYEKAAELRDKIYLMEREQEGETSLDDK